MANKITNANRYEALIDLVNANGISLTVGDATENTEDMVKWLQKQIEAISKKKSSSNDKKNEAFAVVDERVLSVLSTSKAKVGSIVEAVNDEYELVGDDKYSSSRVTASLGRLIKEGKVVNVKEKKDSFYLLAE